MEEKILTVYSVESEDSNDSVTFDLLNMVSIQKPNGEWHDKRLLDMENVKKEKNVSNLLECKAEVNGEADVNDDKIEDNTSENNNVVVIVEGEEFEVLDIEDYEVDNLNGNLEQLDNANEENEECGADDDLNLKDNEANNNENEETGESRDSNTMVELETIGDVVQTEESQKTEKRKHSEEIEINSEVQKRMTPMLFEDVDDDDDSVYMYDPDDEDVQSINDSDEEKIDTLENLVNFNREKICIKCNFSIPIIRWQLHIMERDLICCECKVICTSSCKYGQHIMRHYGVNSTCARRKVQREKRLQVQHVRIYLFLL